jgi:hypothetical protein
LKIPPRFLAHFKPRAVADPATAQVFTTIFQQNLWQDAESVSGPGSSLVKTEVIRHRLPGLLASLEISSLLDAPCGDYNWMRLTRLEPGSYIGVDIVPGLIERNNRLYAGKGRKFQVADITGDKLPRCQAVLCRDCFIHLTSTQILNTLKNFQRSGARYLLATNHPAEEVYREIETGEWRSVNLNLPPFNLPPPLLRMVENPLTGKSLDVWELQKLILK